MSLEGYVVAFVPQQTAVDFVEEHHYSRSAPNTSVVRHGLFTPAHELAGVALWLPPTKNAALTVSEDWRNVLALSRLCVRPDEPKNAASFLLGRSIRRIPERYHTLLTYADSRYGHTGAIYRATNWEYMGSVRGSDAWIGPDGEQRGRKRGGRNWTKQEMLDAGFTELPPSDKHKFVMRRTA